VEPASDASLNSLSDEAGHNLHSGKLGGLFAPPNDSFLPPAVHPNAAAYDHVPGGFQPALIWGEGQKVHHRFAMTIFLE